MAGDNPIQQEMADNKEIFNLANKFIAMANNMTHKDNLNP